MLQSLSIVTITYNNPEGLIDTYNSLESFRKAGGTHIIVNGGITISRLIKNDCLLIEEPDEGIYDAINKGIKLIRTPYFMLIHSGDSLVATLDILKEQLYLMNKKQLDILLNHCSIEFGRGTRLMSSRYWQPWMLKLGAQPPHPPTIYRSESLKDYSYDKNHPIIADFKYFEEIFLSNIKWGKGNYVLVHMTGGGETSSGYTSFLRVSKDFVKLKGNIKAIIIFFTRPIIKLLQMI